MLDSPAQSRATSTGTTPLRLVKAEFMKLRTTASWWLFLGGFILFTAVALLNNWFSQHYVLYPQPDLSDRAQALAQAAQARTSGGVAAIAASMMTSGQFLGVLIVMLLGVHVATSEFAQQTAAATFLTVPRRSRVIAAKLAMAACSAALLWLIATVIDTVVTLIFLRTQHVSTSLTEWVVIRSVLASLLAFVLWAAFGVGLGALLRGQVASIFAGIALYVGGFAAVELIFHGFYDLYHQGWILGAPVIAPAVASQVMVSAGRAFEHAPPQWVGAVILAGWALALAVAGTVATGRRDVT
jgi:ABC-type transport system involved in multi-copper enzyme maturation permease subunit